MQKRNYWVYPIILGIIISIKDCAKPVCEQPHLILTSERVTILKAAIPSTHAHLWELVQRSADEFSTSPIPVMQNAHNRYRRIGDTMPVLGLAYLMTDDKRYVVAAERWLSALLAVPVWRGSGNLGRSSWTVACALLYDWLYNELDEDLRLRIKKRLLEEASIIVKTAARTRALSNHLLIETAAVGLVGLTFRNEAEESEALLQQADEWANYITSHAPRDGSWGEGVQYWQYGLSYFLRFLEAAKTSGYRDYYPQYDWLQQTGFFPIYFSLPGRLTEVINFSDCGSKRYLPASHFYQLAAVYQNGYYQDYANRILSTKPHKFSWMDFIYYDPNISSQDFHTLPTLKHFADNGFVTLRSGWDEKATAIGFRCGPAAGHRNQGHPRRLENRGFGPGHGHPDINSFCLFSHSQWLAIDPGYTYLKETRNHNTVMVNGFGQAGAGKKWLDFMAFEARQPAPAILRIESNPVFDYVLGDAGNIYVDEAKLKHFRRHLLFLKPDIVVIADDLEGKENSRFEWLLNAQDSIVQVKENQFEIVQNGVRLWINPLLPQEYNAEIQTRAIEASDVKHESDVEGGKMTTLNLKVKDISKTNYLVVLCALKDEKVNTPEVTFKNSRLKVSHNGRLWEIIYRKEIKRDDDPLLVVVEPEIGEYFYEFVRGGEMK